MTHKNLVSMMLLKLRRQWMNSKKDLNEKYISFLEQTKDDTQA